MKINLVYHTPQNLGSGYFGSTGLKRALERNGLLNYAFDTVKDTDLDIDRLQEAPVFFIRGFLPGRMSFVAKTGNQFKVTWQSESFYTRRGELDGSTPHAIKNQDHFNMFFTCSETDLDKYTPPTYFLPSWVDTDIFDDYEEPQIFDKLGFFGGSKGREDFLCKDKHEIIDSFTSKVNKNDAVESTRDLSKAINSYQMLVSPPGRCFTGMCGRAWEIIASKRLAFVYYNPDTMFKTSEFFKDGRELVYFTDYDELLDKFRYYKERLDTVKEIAENGYNCVRRFHNADVRVHYITNAIEYEYKRWQEEQKKVPNWVEEAYADL